MPNAYLFHGLRGAPEAILRIVQQVSPSRYDEAVDPARFTFREAVAHMADWEPITLSRLQAGVFEPGSNIEAYDESLRAVEQNYAATDPVAQAHLLIERRAAIIQFLEQHGEGKWDQVVTHPEKGTITLYDQANLILGHDTYHIEHLTRYL